MFRLIELTIFSVMRHKDSPRDRQPTASHNMIPYMAHPPTSLALLGSLGREKWHSYACLFLGPPVSVKFSPLLSQGGGGGGGVSGFGNLQTPVWQ